MVQLTRSPIEIAKIAQQSGWTFARHDASNHRIFTRNGAPRPLSIPWGCKQLGKGLARQLLKRIQGSAIK